MNHPDRYIRQRLQAEADTQRTPERYPEVGVSLFIRRGNELLLGNKRIGEQTYEYGGLGGIFERMQSFGASALRGLVERELGPDVSIEAPEFAFLSNVRCFVPRHFVVMNYVADWEHGEPMSPATSSCQSWEWFDPAALPDQLCLEARQMVEAVLTDQIGRAVFDVY
jgi:8-oxo-dGTP diphosphatase